MNVVVGGKRVALSPQDMLGQGGEACVYRHADLALKIYHPMPARALAARIKKVEDFPRPMPAHVLGPEGLVLEESSKKPIGFAMRAVESAEDFHRLGQRRWREASALGQDHVLALFAKLLGLLSELHQKQIIIGDLNDGNVLFTAGDREVWLIDADSMQYGAHSCVVGHERFLDPRLYGLDLGKGSTFTTDTDWYAFSVLLFSSLLYVHPYGGVHPSLPTLIRRAEARHSLLRGDVTEPKAALSWKVLPDSLIDWFRAIFDDDRRGPFPAGLLSFHFTRCSCGLDHARPRCPACAIQVAVVARDPVLRKGRVRAVRVFETRGRILAAAVEGGTLRYVYEEDGVVRREDGGRVIELGAPAAHDWRFAISGRSTWVGSGTRLVEIASEQPVTRTSTQVVGHEPAFDASGAGCWRIEDQYLVEAASGARFGSVLEGRTWFRVGETLGLGFYRAGLVTVWFLFRLDRPGLVTLDLPPIAGRLVDVDCVFDRDHALVGIETEANGAAMTTFALIRKDGTVLASRSGPPDSSPLLGSVRGKALFGGRILCSTDQGLLTARVDAAARALVEGDLFPDTEPFVSEGDQILPAPGGSVFLINDQQILQLSLM